MTSLPASTPGTRPPAHGLEDLAQFSERMLQLHSLIAAPSIGGRFVAYTDGACFGNPDGPGGWAAVVRQEDAQDEDAADELWGHLRSTSNNRAEALAVLAALEWMPQGATLLVRSDSELTVKIFGGLYKAKANQDIWRVIRRTTADKRLSAQLDWVRGHVGDLGNERADRLSVLGAVDGDLDKWERLATTSARSRDQRRPSDAPAGFNAPPAELAGLEPRGAWETSFLASVARQLRGGRALSEKQEAVLARIRARAE